MIRTATASSSSWTPIRRSGARTRVGSLRSDRWRCEGLALRQLLDILARKRLQAGEEALHLPLGGVVREDELLRAASVRDVGDPIVEVGRAAVGDGHPAQSHPTTPSTIASGFRPSIAVSSSYYYSDPAGRDRPKNQRERRCPHAAQLTSVEISLSRSRLHAPNARFASRTATSTSDHRGKIFPGAFCGRMT